MSDQGSSDGGRGFRFVVRGETTIMDSDGTPIGRLHPGNTYVAIEITDDYVVIRSPTKGRAFVEVESVEMMDDTAPLDQQASAPPTAMAAPATPTPAPTPTIAPGDGTATAAVPLWKQPAVLIGALVLVAAAVVGTLLVAGGSNDDSAGSSTPAEAEVDATTDEAEVAAPDEPAPTAAPAFEPTTAPAPAEPEPTAEAATGSDGGANADEASADTAAADGPSVVAGDDVVVSDGSLENKVFTHTARGDLTNASFHDSPGPAAPPSVIWRTDDPLSSEVVRVPGAVIAGFSDRTLRALDSRTGAELWRTQIDIFRTNDIWVADDTVVAATGSNFTLFDVSTGEQVGFIEPPTEEAGGAHDALLVAGVFVGVWTQSQPGDVTATVVAFDAATGSSLWQLQTQGENFPPPMTFARGNVVYGHGTTVHAFDVLTGEQAWAYQVDRLLPLVLTGVDDFVLIRDSALRALDATSGSVVWTGSDVTGIHFPVDRGRVLAPSTEPGVIDLATGARRSAGRVADELFGRSTAVAADGIGYVQLSEGNIVAIDLETASQLWTADVSDNEFSSLAPMAAGDGLLFILEEDNQLIAVG